MARKTYKIWEGNGMTLLISRGGNKKTKTVVELTLVPTFIVDNWSKIKGDEKNSIRMGKLYVQALKDLNLLAIVCPESCGHFIAGTCYVQHNPRNAAQVVGILNGLQGTLTHGQLCVWLVQQRADGVTSIRSMVAGDAGMIPEDDWKALERVILGIFPADEWLGYTHTWKTSVWLQKTHVASVETTAEALEARAMGWAVFETGSPTVDKLPVGATLCPSSKQFENHKGFKIGCNSCPIRCNGARGKHVVIPRHAMGDSGKWKRANKLGVQILDSKGRVRGVY